MKKIDMNKQKKSNAIYKAAIKVFAKKGFHKAKITEIAELADVADGTIYTYYKDKNDLFISVFSTLIEEKLKIITREIMSEETAIARLHKFFNLQLDMLVSDKTYSRMLIQEMKQNPLFYTKFPDFKPVSIYINFLKDLIKQAIDEGSIRKINPHTAAIMIFGSIDFALTEWLLNKNVSDMETLKSEILDIMHNGFKN